MRRKRKRSVTIVVQYALFEDIPIILELIREYGEGNVDIRRMDALIEAIVEGQFHIFVDLESDEVVGFGAVYPYDADGQQRNELGTSVLVKKFRGRGIADASVAFRCLYAMQADPGSRCVSEIYLGSEKSRAVLERNGFREVVPDQWAIEHAAAASAEPVRHMALVDGAVPSMANLVLGLVEGAPMSWNGVETYIRFSNNYWVTSDWGRAILSELSRGDLSAIRPDNDERRGEPVVIEGDVPVAPPANRSK